MFASTPLQKRTRPCRNCHCNHRPPVSPRDPTIQSKSPSPVDPAGYHTIRRNGRCIPRSSHQSNGLCSPRSNIHHRNGLGRYHSNIRRNGLCRYHTVHCNGRCSPRGCHQPSSPCSSHQPSLGPCSAEKAPLRPQCLWLWPWEIRGAIAKPRCDSTPRRKHPQMASITSRSRTTTIAMTAPGSAFCEHCSWHPAPPASTRSLQYVQPIQGAPAAGMLKPQA